MDPLTKKELLINRKRLVDQMSELEKDGCDTYGIAERIVDIDLEMYDREMLTEEEITLLAKGETLLDENLEVVILDGTEFIDKEWMQLFGLPLKSARLIHIEKMGYITIPALGKLMYQQGMFVGSYWSNKFSKKVFYISEIWEAEGRVSQSKRVFVTLKSTVETGRKSTTKIMDIEDLFNSYEKHEFEN